MKYRPLPILGAAIAAMLPALSPAHANTLVEVSTPLGNIVMQMRPQDAPSTVWNFLNYIGDGDYEDSIVHRSAFANYGPPEGPADFRPFVIQGGGFYPFLQSEIVTVPPTFPTVPVDPPIINEPGASNLRGTVAMARSSGVNSATSQWYINVNDNPGLDTQNQGFTVFADVVSGMDIVDAIAALGRWNFDSIAPASTPFSEVPMLDSFTGQLPWTLEHFVTTSSRVMGDADGDGDIDDTDLGIMIANFNGPGGTGKTIATGDVDGDGDVDDTDLGVAIAGFSGPLQQPTYATAAVPEPTSLTLLAIGAALGMRRRR